MFNDMCLQTTRWEPGQYGLGLYKGQDAISQKQLVGDRVAGLAAFEECKDRKRL